MSEETARYSFRNLKIWESAQQLAADIIRVAVRMPKNEVKAGIAPQLIASAGSVGANIAEGHGRYSVAAYRNHLSIARGSLAETESWIDLLERLDVIPAATGSDFQRRCAELTGGITRQMQSLQRKLSEEPKGIREEPATASLEARTERGMRIAAACSSLIAHCPMRDNEGRTR
jgi:four helix bundle protein